MSPITPDPPLGSGVGCGDSLKFRTNGENKVKPFSSHESSRITFRYVSRDSSRSGAQERPLVLISEQFSVSISEILESGHTPDNTKY